MQILDGAIGTELEARGVELRGRGWSSSAIMEAADALGALHAAYAQAGATIHTANTFRTQPAAIGDEWGAALHAAVSIAKRAVPSHHLVLGSLAPIEDCYRPDLSPGRGALDTHRKIAGALVDAGCDIVLCETFAHEQEALAAVEGAVATGVPVWLSLTAGPAGDLLAPSDVARIGRRAVEAGAACVLANCIAASLMDPFAMALASLGTPFGVYANAGDTSEGIGWGGAECEGPSRYSALAAGWASAGAEVIGGCCGIGPKHIEAVARTIGSGSGGALGVV